MTHTDDCEANTARAVACVNACADINPEAVPMLLEACKAAIARDDYECSLAFDFGIRMPQDTRKKIKKALDKAKEKIEEKNKHE